MKYRTVFLVVLGIPALCLASQPDPFSASCAMLNRIAVRASQSQTSALALDVLERISLGRTEGIGDEIVAQVGVSPAEFRQTAFNDPTVRGCAFRSLGQTGLTEVVNFLTALKVADVAPDSTQEVWPAAQIALREALLIQAPDAYAKVEFLEKTLESGSDAISNSAVASWAVDQLCDRGSLRSLPVVQSSIRKRDPFQTGLEEIAFCEARVQVLSRDPNRAKALGSVLQTSASRPDARLITWAVRQLNSLHTAEADRQLENFAAAIGKLPANTSENGDLYQLRREILERSKSDQIQ